MQKGWDTHRKNFLNKEETKCKGLEEELTWVGSRETEVVGVMKPGMGGGGEQRRQEMQ